MKWILFWDYLRENTVERWTLRSILREKSQDFFTILQHDKSEWMDFWNQYCQENKEFMNGYTQALGLSDKKIETILTNTARPFLDRIKQKNEQIKHLKQKAAKTLNQFSQELELTKEDFVLYLVGALGINDTIAFNNNDRVIVLIDIVALYKNNKIDELQNIVLTSAKKARKSINEKSQEGF